MVSGEHESPGDEKVKPDFWRNKKVLITGGAGFIGSNLAEELVRLGSSVRVADNLERGREEYLLPVRGKIDFMKLDLTSREACKKACEDAEIIFHLASKVGGIGYYMQKPGEVIRNNILMDTLVFQAAIETKVERYLYASSAHVYPIELQLSTDSVPIRERQAYPANPELSYGWAKLIGEKMIEYRIQEGSPTRCAIVRLIGAFGKNQDLDLETGSAIPVFCRRVIEYPTRKPFVIWGTGQETRSYCYVVDVIEGMLLSVEKLTGVQLAGPINLGSEGRISMEELARMIIDISGKQIDIVKDLSKQTVIWGQAVDCSEARDLLDGWHPRTSLADALKLTYRHIETRLS
jgi:nucleoside-diphosphate-sugar epimerase